MQTTPLQRENHYVPCVYLKGFAGPDGRVQTYRLLVSHRGVRLWKEHSPRAIAYHSHLYTRTTSEGLSDEVENWLAREFETPAAEPLQRAVSDRQLTREDWTHLVRFAAAQTLRTPARLYEHIQRWKTQMPELLDDVVEKSVEKLERVRRGEHVERVSPPSGRSLPFRVTTELKEGDSLGTIKSEIVVGRGTWLFSIQHILTNTATVLNQHQWTILKAPEGLQWFTSDDPVILLNFYGEENYDFKGGWGNPGSEILFPLSSRHLLYTKVGERRLAPAGTVVSRPLAQMIRRFIAEHAHRMIFATAPVEDLPELRIRIVDPRLVSAEAEQWRRWHDEQAAAERSLMGW